MKNYPIISVAEAVKEIERVTRGGVSREKIEQDEISMRKSLRFILLAEIPAMYKDSELQSFGYIGDEIQETLKALFSEEENSDKGLILTGVTGCGKTYAMYAIWKWLAEHDPSKCIIFENYARFLQQIRYEFSNDLYSQTGSMWDRAVNGSGHPGVVMLDDIGTSKFSDFEMEKLYLLLDSRIPDYEPIILSINLDKNELFKDVYGDRIGSRLNLLKRINFPDHDFRDTNQSTI